MNQTPVANAHALRVWPAHASNFTTLDITTAFGITKTEAQTFLPSQAVIDSVAPSLAQITTKNVSPVGQPPLGKLQEYISLLNNFVDNARGIFRLEGGDSISIEDIRDAHRVLICACRLTMRSANPPHTTPKRTPCARPATRRVISFGSSADSFKGSTSVQDVLPTGSVARSSLPGHNRPSSQLPRSRNSESPPHIVEAPHEQPEPVFSKRVDLQTIWDNPPLTNTGILKHMGNIQLALPKWNDFERWLETAYDLVSLGFQSVAYKAFTTPSSDAVFARFDLKNFDLSEDSWELAVCAASRQGLLMIVFTTGTRELVPPALMDLDLEVPVDSEEHALREEPMLEEDVEKPGVENQGYAQDTKDMVAQARPHAYVPALGRGMVDTTLTLQNPPVTPVRANTSATRGQDMEDGSDFTPGISSDESDMESVDELSSEVELNTVKLQPATSRPEIQPKSRPAIVVDNSDVELIHGGDFDNFVLAEIGEDSHTKEGGNDSDAAAAGVEWLHRIMDNEIFQRENLDESFVALGIDPDTRALPLIKPHFKFMDHQIIGINWMKEQEEGLASGGLLADDCGTGKTMTLLGLLCFQVSTHETWRARHIQKYGSKDMGQPMGPTLIICPVPMIAEWEEAIKSNTELTPIRHYGESFFDRTAFNKIQESGRPWRHVIITTKETLMKRWFRSDITGQRFWGAGVVRFQPLVVDEAHRFRSSGVSVGQNINPQTGSTYRVDANSAAINLAKHLDCLNPEKKWMLTATPMVNSLADLRWVCRFLERPEWLSQNLPQDTFVDRDDLECGLWEAGVSGSSADGTHPKSMFTPVANPFNNPEYHGSYVHCTTIAWDRFVSHHLGSSIKLQFQQRERILTAGEIQNMSNSQRISGSYAKEILRTLILRRSMVSRIPFENGTPIIDIPVMRTTTTRLKFANDGSKSLYTFLVDNYHEMRKSSSPASQQTSTGGHRFSPRWRYIRLVSLSPLLAYASFADDYSTTKLFEEKVVDNGNPHRMMVKTLLSKFHGEFPDEGLDYYKQTIADMTDDDLTLAMEFSSPKLGWIKNRLQQLVMVGKKKVILWVYWPLSQWLVREYVRLLGFRCFAIHSGLNIKTREKIKSAFNKTKDIDVLVLSYLCSNEGINLHYQCHNTIMVEQGLSYASEHQAWSRVRRIGQRAEQVTERIVNLETIDLLIERAQRERQSPMLYAFGIMEQLGETADTDEVFDTLIGRIQPGVLRDLVIGRGGRGIIELE